MHQPLTPDEIVQRTFTTTRFRQGYDADEVDNHLDALVEALRAHVTGAPVDHLPHSSQAANVAFTTTRWRDGYDQQEVDAFLELVRDTLAAHEAGAPQASSRAPMQQHAPEPEGTRTVPASWTDPSSSPATLTSDEVVSVLLPSVRFGAAYDSDQVDNHLDRCIATLRALERGTPLPGNAVTGADVRATRFGMSSFREGYAIAVVDAYLARVADSIDAHGGPHP